MKLRELMEYLKNFDGELEVVRFEPELGEHFPLELEEIVGKEEMYDVNGGLFPTDEAMEIIEDEEGTFDKNLVKKVFVIWKN